jgi:hypothetical protein
MFGEKCITAIIFKIDTSLKDVPAIRDRFLKYLLSSDHKNSSALLFTTFIILNQIIANC